MIFATIFSQAKSMGKLEESQESWSHEVLTEQPMLFSLNDFKPGIARIAVAKWDGQMTSNFIYASLRDKKLQSQLLL